MLNRLKQMKLHYEQLAEKIASPEVMADMNAWRELVKEHSTLEPIIAAYDEYLENDEMARKRTVYTTEGMDIDD